MSDPTTTQGPPASAPPEKKKDRTHYLYIAVIAAVVLGVIVGLVAPDVGKALKPLGTAFVNLIKMMISPVIFCTIVLGVGSIRQAAKVGKVGGLALAYFIAMSTVALIIGLVVGNLLQPGAGLQLTDAARAAGEKAAGGEAESTTEFLLGIIPTTLVSPLTGEIVLQTLFVALFIGFAVQGLGASGQAILRGIKHFERLVFKILAMIMWAAPIGAFGAIAAVVGETGWAALAALGQIMLAFYITCALFIIIVLGAAAAHGYRAEHLRPAQVPGPGVPADRLHLVVGDRAAAAGGQDGAPGRLPPGGRHHGAHRLLVQPRRHRDLPDDGLAVHRRGHGHAAVDRRADLAAAVHDHRIQGCRRRDRRGAGHPGRRADRRTGPTWSTGVGLIVGIDRFMSEARAVTNFSGNAVATVLIGKWVGEFDKDKADRVLAGNDPFDEDDMLDDDDEEAPEPGRGVPGPSTEAVDGDHYGQAAELGLST